MIGGPSSGDDAAQDAGAPVMAAAQIALGLGLRGSGDREIAKRATELLVKQSQMLDLQMEDMHEQRQLQISHLRLRRWISWFSLGLRGLTVLVGVGVVATFGLLLWQASNARGVVIAPFSAPPELVGRGLSGEVLANRLLDELAALQSQTDSARAANTFRSALDDEIKVEIPQTGVSLGELLQVFRRWLGHETRISGDVVKGPTGLTVTSRVNGSPAVTVTGDEAALGDLMRTAAAAVYAQAQPYRYGVYLARNGRTDEARDVLDTLSRRGPPTERAWAYIGLGSLAADPQERLTLLRRGLALNPRLAPGWTALAEEEGNLGHDEAALSGLRKARDLLALRGAGGTSPLAAAQGRLRVEAAEAEAVGDFARASRAWSDAALQAGNRAISAEAGAREAIDLAFNHDLAELDDAQRWDLADPTAYGPLLRAKAEIARATVTDDWAGTVSTLEAIERTAQARGPDAYSPSIWATQVHPWRAYALARSGRLAEARALAAATPGDCYPCLRARGLVEAAGGDRRAAQLWLDRAISSAPSLPFAYVERARLALLSGDPRQAAALAKQAREIAPRWADAAAVSAEAHQKLGRCVDARRDFATASALAPNWRPRPQATGACAEANPPGK
ncbi:MAG: hypothetical protein V4759_09905 [Pseudomonadota bacterium]